MDTKETKIDRKSQTDGIGSGLVRLFLMFMLISCIGWCMETAYVLLRFGHLSDRGFLSMPFCPIYGASILAVYFAVGTPQGGVLQPLFAKAKGLPLPARAAAYAGLYLLYFLAAALIPTAAEFLTDLFFDKLFGIRLWDYTDRPFNILGYVCLPMSALWGLLITAAMALLWTPLEKLLARIPQRAAKAVAFTLAALLLIDFCGNFIYLCATGAHYYLF